MNHAADCVLFSAFSPFSSELLADVVTYIRPHDLTGIIAKGLKVSGSKLERNVTISFRNLSYTDDQGRPKLQGITGYIRPKMMLCVLGGPDAGITTFLDVLAERQKGGQVSGVSCQDDRSCDGDTISAVDDPFSVFVTASACCRSSSVTGCPSRKA
jgi:hypothetical protein